MVSRLKKIAMDIGERDFAIAYINGEIFSARSHASCINEYLNVHSNDGLNSARFRPDMKLIDDIENIKNMDVIISPSEIEDLKIIKDNIEQLAFAHVVDGSNEDSGHWPEDGKHIYIEQNTLFNIDMDSVVNAIKQAYPDYNIYIEETEEKIARLKKNAEDSTNVAPNGIIWNDNIWDTYDLVNEDQKSTINREWLFDKPIDNAEWMLQN